MCAYLHPSIRTPHSTPEIVKVCSSSFVMLIYWKKILHFRTGKSVPALNLKKVGEKKRKIKDVFIVRASHFRKSLELKLTWLDIAPSKQRSKHKGTLTNYVDKDVLNLANLLEKILHFCPGKSMPVSREVSTREY